MQRYGYIDQGEWRRELQRELLDLILGLLAVSLKNMNPKFNLDGCEGYEHTNIYI